MRLTAQSLKLHPRKPQCIQAEPCPCCPVQNPTQTTLNPRLQRAAGSPPVCDWEGFWAAFPQHPGALNEDSRKMISLLVHSSNDSAQGSSTARHQMAPSCTSQKAHRSTMTNSLPRKLQSTVEGSGSLGLGRLHQALATCAEMRMQHLPALSRGGEGRASFLLLLVCKQKS